MNDQQYRVVCQACGWTAIVTDDDNIEQCESCTSERVFHVWLDRHDYDEPESDSITLKIEGSNALQDIALGLARIADALENRND